jgi:CheY-like chemotaxis protein
MNGLEFLRILKKEDKYAQIPLIAYADALNQDIIKEYKKMGVANLLESPINLKLLRESIEEALK